MGKLLVLASAVVTIPKQGPRAVSAYVVLSAGLQSRIFHVRGSADTPAVEELPRETTLDSNQFERQLHEDLQPTLEELRIYGHPAHVEFLRPEWLTTCVRDHLKTTEGIDVE